MSDRKFAPCECEGNSARGRFEDGQDDGAAKPQQPQSTANHHHNNSSTTTYDITTTSNGCRQTGRSAKSDDTTG